VPGASTTRSPSSSDRPTRHACCGSSAYRSPSPSRLNDSTSTKNHLVRAERAAARPCTLPFPDVAPGVDSCRHTQAMPAVAFVANRFLCGDDGCCNFLRKSGYMRMLLNARPLLFFALLCTIPAVSFAQVAVSITVAPPPIPVYAQPPCPSEGFLWTPGYWGYGPAGYFWVPGVWVAPPRPGLLWTPG